MCVSGMEQTNLAKRCVECRKKCEAKRGVKCHLPIPPFVLGKHGTNYIFAYFDDAPLFRIVVRLLYLNLSL